MDLFPFFRQRASAAGHSRSWARQFLGVQSVAENGSPEQEDESRNVPPGESGFDFFWASSRRTNRDESARETLFDAYGTVGQHSTGISLCLT